MATLVTAYLALANCSSAATIVVSADNIVLRHFPTTNRGTDPLLGAGSGFIAEEGGDIDGRSYLKFALPSRSAGTVISSAVLSGYYLYGDDPRIDDMFSFYLAEFDTWTEAAQNWNNEPGTIGPALVSFASAGLVSGTRYSWDVTSVVNSQYLGDGVLSLVLRADNESLAAGSSYKYFASREHSSNQPFQLEYTIVPEPSTALLLSLGVGLFCPRWCVSHA